MNYTDPFPALDPYEAEIDRLRQALAQERALRREVEAENRVLRERCEWLEERGDEEE